MSNKNLTESEKIIQRLQLELGVATKTDLAEALGYKSVSAISNWKSRGIDWNRIIQKHPSLDVKYIKTGVKNMPTIDNEKTHKVKRLMEEYESRKAVRPPSDTEREILLEFLQQQAEALSKGLRRLNDLQRLEHSDSSRQDDG